MERFFPRSGHIDQVAELTRRLNRHHWVYGAGVDISADEVKPDGSVLHRRQQFGNLLLSRSPIVTARHHLLPKHASVGPLSIQRSALEGVIDCVGYRLRVYSVHLTHISSAVRLQQIDTLLDIDRNAVREGGPIAGNSIQTDFAGQADVSTLPRESILMGDFNFTPDAEEYSRIVGIRSDYGGRVINPEGFVDAWQVAGHAEMSGTTAQRRGKNVRMDYCFVRHSLSHRIRDAKIHSAAVGSDHKPVSMWLEF